MTSDGDPFTHHPELKNRITDPLRSIYRTLDLDVLDDKMRAAGAVKQDFPLLSSPELEQARKLMTLSTSNYVEIKSAELSLSLRRD